MEANEERVRGFKADKNSDDSKSGESKEGSDDVSPKEIAGSDQSSQNLANLLPGSTHGLNFGTNMLLKFGVIDEETMKKM
jgi:hypothetical protein